MDEIKTITIKDKDYPELIKQLPDAPKVLYYQGILPTNDEKIVAVVGTRHPSDYGHQATHEIVKTLAKAGVTVISGLAPGIDTLAHATCIEYNTRTIAVLGTSLDKESLYPKSNLALSRQIIRQGGCLISEFPLGTRGTKFTFPMRNRIVSALSQGVVVIEAKERSGSLITARLAREQQKKLFAVPGSIFSANSKGPNMLLKQGAILAENGELILEALNMSHQKVNAESLIGDTKEETLILQTISNEALYIDAIIEKTKLPAQTISTTLALMEISGKIRNLGGNVYSIN